MKVTGTTTLSEIIGTSVSFTVTYKAEAGVTSPETFTFSFEAAE